MGRGSVRTGKPTTGTIAAAGTTNSLTDPKIIIFDPPVRPCLIRLTDSITVATAPVLIKVNTELDGTVSDDFSDIGTAHFALKELGETKDLSVGGQVAIHSVSFATQDNSDDIADVLVEGYEP